MSRLIDLTSKRFGRLVVIKRVDNDKWGNVRWLCRCNCDDKNEVIVRGSNLRDGTTKSCSCLQKEIAFIYCKKYKFKHGHAKKNKITKTYWVWQDMIKRCTNPNHSRYMDWGGRGITVCDEWLHSFPNFLKDMGEAPKGFQLERIDNNGDYHRENCCWTTSKEQGRNKRNNRLITYNGKTQCLAAWTEETGISWETLYARICRYGWSTEKALTTPVRKRRK